MSNTDEGGMAATSIGFSWVNYTSTSLVEKDEEDISIIKSHAMRLVHKQRHPQPEAKRRRMTKKSTDCRRPTASSASPALRANLPFVYRPQTDWEGVAICRFMEEFVYPEPSSPGNAFQYLSFLPSLYDKYSARSCLTEAISAVAYARLANQVHAVDLSFRARKAYASALSLVNQSMCIPEARKSDDVLATLCLLTKYEVMSGDITNNTVQWRFHETGQAALLFERGEEQLTTYVGLSLFRLIYIRQQFNCIAQCQRPTVALESHHWAVLFPTEHLRRLMELIAEIANLRFRSSMHPHQISEDSNQSCRLVEDALKVDGDMDAFVGALPSHMEYSTTANDIASKHDAEQRYVPKQINVFRDLQHASFWHVLWYARIHILRTVLQFSLYQLKLEPRILQSRLRQTVDDICASIPYILSDENCTKGSIKTKGGRSVAAHYLIWMLAAASSVPGIPESQKEWISERLKIIGFVHGIKYAFVFA